MGLLVKSLFGCFSALNLCLCCFLSLYEQKSQEEKGLSGSLQKSRGRKPWSAQCVRTDRIGANPEKSTLVSFRGPSWRRFSELSILLFLLRKINKIHPKPPFSKPIFGHRAGSTKLDRPHCKQFRLWTETLEFRRLKMPNSWFALHGLTPP